MPVPYELFDLLLERRGKAELAFDLGFHSAGDHLTVDENPIAIENDVRQLAHHTQFTEAKISLKVLLGRIAADAFAGEGL